MIVEDTRSSVEVKYPKGSLGGPSVSVGYRDPGRGLSGPCQVAGEGYVAPGVRLCRGLGRVQSA